jgi:hypothetical protein
MAVKKKKIKVSGGGGGKLPTGGARIPTRSLPPSGTSSIKGGGVSNAKDTLSDAAKKLKKKNKKK